MPKFYLVITFLLLLAFPLSATIIPANPTNYTAALATLAAGDTLMLAAGKYTNNLTLKSKVGTAARPIVIMGQGDATVFEGQSCCNTISITQCAFVVISHLRLDGMNQEVDAVKAEGTAGNWAHDITLEYLTIVQYGASQQNVGISTKCPAWNWTIRKNRIIGAGTGMYLGNSDGTKPFVNGVIEYNYIGSTVGYNCEIKHQINGQRELLPETSVDAKTIIRHNVFMKDSLSSTGVSARPNLLVGGFPTSGPGMNDYYEIYGNFFYNNPAEALFQGTGNITLYTNIFVNHYNPYGFRTVYITPQNGVSPQDVKVYHNTIWTASATGGLRLYNRNANYRQYCYGNAVFAPAAPISNFPDTLDNVMGKYTDASAYFLAATEDISTLNLYPQNGRLTGTPTPDTAFRVSSSREDFNHDAFQWIYRGAYSGCCTNLGWKLQLDTMPSPKETTSVDERAEESDVIVAPNPVRSLLRISSPLLRCKRITLTTLTGEQVFVNECDTHDATIDMESFPPGIYLLRINGGRVRKIVKW